MPSLTDVRDRIERDFELAIRHSRPRIAFAILYAITIANEGQDFHPWQIQQIRDLEPKIWVHLYERWCAQRQTN
jgi:hypothetical protein